MGEIRPLVINREVVMPAISDKRKIIVNASEYDGMREWTDVRPLTVSNVIKDIKDWDREWDYCDPSNCEYSWGFFLEYRKKRAPEEHSLREIRMGSRWNAFD